MGKGISAIWAKKFPDLARQQLHEIFLSPLKNDGKLQLFFRADDIARVDASFRRLMHMFTKHAMPLCLAVVPDWMNQVNWKAMGEFNPASSLWCWHQHGKSHRNHEKQGKKCEFGASRSRTEISTDITRGRDKLTAIMGELFYPVFTPPWNRCGQNTLELLQELNYKAVSRAEKAKPRAEFYLPDLAVNVDLHTRRERDFTTGWQNLLQEFADAAGSGRMGIMLHHQLMNEEAFTFLDMLLAELRLMENVDCCTFRELR